MTKIVFEVDKLAIAYIMQLRGIRNFGVSRKKWNKLLRKIYNEKDKLLVTEIQKELKEEYAAAEKLKEIVEREWRRYEKYVLTWIKELTKVGFKEPTVRVCVVPFGAGQTPCKNVPLIMVGKIRKGWEYPETLAHELLISCSTKTSSLKAKRNILMFS